MAANIASCLKLTSWTDPENLVRKPGGFWRFSQVHWKHQRLLILSSYSQPRRTASWHRPAASEVSCSYQKLPASNLEPGNFPASFDEAAALKKKAEEIEPYLNGRCIYLVGMMGSGKTTVGRILSDALGYSFFDSDTLIEQATGKSSVAEIFNLYGESFFRENETEVLKKLSIMHNLVVSTGGGVVIRPVNWKYMQKGITVWLDVPLEALARRIAAVGTESRPLLHQESNDAYAKTLLRLSTLLEERGELYANANAQVSLENIAAKLGYRDTCNLTPIVIAIEALTQILSFLKK